MARRDPIADAKAFVDRFAAEDSDADEDDTDFQHFALMTATLDELLDAPSESREKSWGGSVPGRTFVQRNHAVGARQLFNDYFAPRPIFGKNKFRRRFRMRQRLFLRVVNKLAESNPFFKEKPDCRGKCLSTLQKATAAFRQLAYGLPSGTCPIIAHMTILIKNHQYLILIFIHHMTLF